MELEARIEGALRQLQPVEALHQLAIRLRDEGLPRATIISGYTKALERVLAAGEERATEEDALRDALDFLTGWCSPHMRVFPNEPIVSGD